MEFSINEDVTTYSDAEIADLIVQGNAALDAALANETPTPADADEAERISAAVAALTAEQGARIAAADRMATLRNSRTTTASAEGSDAEGDDAPGEGEGEQEQSEDEQSGDDNADAEGDDENDTEEDGESGTSDNEEGDAAVTASSRTRGLRGTRPAEGVRDDTNPVTITAAADVPTFATGAVLDDLDAVAEAVAARVKGFPQRPMGLEGGALQRYGVATFTRQFPEEFIAKGEASDLDAIDAASNEHALDGGSLVAAGGWCAPSETLYDLCAGETTDGLIDLPEIQVSRGGVRYTSGPNFGDFYGNDFKQTEAQAIAGTTKPCYEITCPPFTEVRLDAVGLCIKVPLLTNAAYPELTRRVISGSIIAHQHRVSADLITKIVTAAGTPIAAGSVGSIAGNALNAVELVISTEAERYRLGLNSTMEVLMPHWLRGALRADLAMRNGVDLLSVSDADLDRHFASRRARVQWLYNWQPLQENGTTYPNTARIVVYPAGTFVKGVTDVISLDAVYDAASLQVNTMTGLFMEEGILLLQKCWKAKAIDLNLCAAGVTGAANNEACFALADPTP